MRIRTLLPIILVVFQCVLTPLELPAQTGFQKIKHVVMVIQENRTPDNLFHGFPGADIANTGLNSKGVTITLKPEPLATQYDPYHGHKSFLAMYDGGKMDGADLVKVRCGRQNPKHCVIPRHPQFKYVDLADVVPYFDMAKQYTFADRMFSTMQSSSYPAHQYVIAGTSAISEGSDLLASESPYGGDNPPFNTGCRADPIQRVPVIDPAGDESQRVYPCYEHQTLMDLLDAKGIGWRYYTYGEGSIWTGPNSIDHIRNGPAWNNVILENTVVLSDIAAGHLRRVSWVIPRGKYGDHSGGNLGGGPSWVASIVNAIGNSKYWDDTAIVIFWDDWGGWYDHVAPQVINSFEYGFRVPMIVVSPYAKPGYVSHVTHDFGSILKFVEAVYGLPSLGYADANADDLSDCFDFNQAPIKFKTIAAPLDASFFLNDTSPGWEPDDE
jgi:phospholipase C